MADLLVYDILDMTAAHRPFKEHGESRVMKRGEYFCHIEQPTRDVALVTSGSFSFSKGDNKGREHIFSLAFDGDIIGAVVSLQPGRRSALDVKALSRSELLVMPVDRWLSDMEIRQPGFRQALADAIAYSFMMRSIAFRCSTPEERYMELLERVPNIRNMVSMTAIASYLGISREAFSRLRSLRNI